MSEYQLLLGDCLDVMRTMESGSVQCCVTSPPYFGLRDYGMDGQIGLEETPELYVAKLVEVFREVRRLLKDDGVLWLNLGDSYAGSANSGGVNQNDGGVPHRMTGLPAKGGNGIKPKDLIGIPWMVAFALRADGWWLRQDIIWHKPNPMPESVTDRCTKAHEYIFLLSKSGRYYYDADAIRESFADDRMGNPGQNTPAKKLALGRDLSGFASGDGQWNEDGQYIGRNRRSVWTVSTKPYAEAHFATFPPDLIEPCVLAGSKAGDTVLDPFNGSGTTGAVALKHGRKYVGIELNPNYIELAHRRIQQMQPLLLEVA